MIKKIAIVIMLCSFTLSAQFEKGKVILTTKEVKEGYIGSLTEYHLGKKLIPGASLHKRLNIDDKSITFKYSLEDKEPETIGIEDVSLLILSEGKNKKVYKPLFAAGFNSKGILTKSKRKLWLPLVMDQGSFQIYGYIINEVVNGANTITYDYYLYKEGNDFGIAPLSQLNTMDLINSSKMMEATKNEINHLIVNCPGAVEEINLLSVPKKRKRAERKILKEQFNTLSETGVEKYLDARGLEKEDINKYLYLYGPYFDALFKEKELCANK